MPPLNNMLKYFVSSRQCNRPAQNVDGASSSQRGQILDKGKAPLVPDLQLLEVIPATAVQVASRKRTRAYDGNRRFKPEWTSIFPWAEPVIEQSGECRHIKCLVCSAILGKSRLILNKMDNMRKHEGLWKARSDMTIGNVTVKVGEKYTLPDCAHWKNEKIWIARGLNQTPKPIPIVTDIKEQRRKATQFIIIFDMPIKGRPMTDYPLTHTLLTFLEVPNLPKKHWCVSSGWGIVENIQHIVDAKTQDTLRKAHFFAVSADEVTSIDNEVWISIHAYIVERHARLPILLGLKRVARGCTSKNLASVISDCLIRDGGLTVDEVAEKFMSFGADGASVFHGAKTGVTKRLVDYNAPYMHGQHCVAHRTNLAVLCLSNFPLVSKIKQLCSAMYTYFSKSPKRQLAFAKLAEELDTGGNKILRNVKTRWISMLPPMIRILEEYKTLVLNMSTGEKGVAQENLDLLCDFETLISLAAMIPMLEIVNDLIKFTQSRDVYVCDFLATVKLCQAKLYRKFLDAGTSFQRDSFREFCDIVGDATHVVDFEWVTDLETHEEYLCMRVQDHKFPCHWISGAGNKIPLTRDDFTMIVAQVKAQCREAAQLLMTELDHRYPDVDVLNALGVVLSQYWHDPACHKIFPLHFDILLREFATARSVLIGMNREQKAVKEPLDRRELEQSMSIFKSTMIGNSTKVMEANIDRNPLTILWNKIAASGHLSQRIPEWFKLAEIAIVTVIGSVEDERTFSTLAWMKSKVRNRLGSHLDCTLTMYSQSFYSLSNFPYSEAIKHWEAERERRGLGY